MMLTRAATDAAVRTDGIPAVPRCAANDTTADHVSAVVLYIPSATCTCPMTSAPVEYVGGGTVPQPCTPLVVHATANSNRLPAEEYLR